MFTPQLRQVSGPLAGIAFRIPAGVSTIGRGRSSSLCLADAEVSRRHATLQRVGDQVILTDLGFTNGTSVNGQPLRGSSRQLYPGDVLRIGSIDLAYGFEQAHPIDHPPANGTLPLQVAPLRHKRRVRPVRIFIVAGLIELVGFLIEAGFTYLAGRTVGVLGWLMPPTGAVVVGIVGAAIEAGTDRDSAESSAIGPTPKRRRGMPALAAVLAIVLVAGVGGYGAAVGLRYGVGWFTGSEDQIGQERLASSPPPSGGSGRLTLTVTGIVNTAHYTRVSVIVDNEENDPAVLNIFHNCVLTGGSVTLQANPFRSRWTEEVPPQSRQQGQLVFPSHLPDGAASAQLSFLTVMRLGPTPPGTVVIRPIGLRAP